MKKFKIGMIMAVFAFIVMLPQQAYAAGSVSLEHEPDTTTVSVELTLPSAAQEKTSSLQLRLEVASTAVTSAGFTFDNRITETAKVAEARWNQERKEMNLYIAGTDPLYRDGESTIALGELDVQVDSETRVQITADNVRLVRGSKVDALDSIESSKEYVFGPAIGTDPSPLPSSSPSPSPSSSPSPSPSSSPSPGVSPSASPSPGPTVKPVAAPKATKVAKLTNSSSGIVVRWKRSSDASGYYVYRKTAKTNWKRIAKVSGRDKLTYTDKAVRTKNGARYFYTVRAFNGKKLSSPDKKGLQIFRMTAPTLTKVTGGTSKKMLIKWKQNKKASGYKIQYSTSSRFDKNLGKVTIRSGKITSKTVSKLKKKGTYHVRICSYKKVNGKIYYSGWSSVKKVKIK